MSQPGAERCGGCRHWLAFRETSEHGAPDIGTCKLNPPTVLPPSIGPRQALPQMGASDWCGQWSGLQPPGGGSTS